MIPEPTIKTLQSKKVTFPPYVAAEAWVSLWIGAGSGVPRQPEILDLVVERTMGCGPSASGRRSGEKQHGTGGSLYDWVDRLRDSYERVKGPEALLFDPPVEFKPLIPDLTFITNKKMWSGHLRQAMREIPEEDYRLILRRAGEEA